MPKLGHAHRWQYNQTPENPILVFPAAAVFVCLQSGGNGGASSGIVVFLIIHLLVYPASNGYNSYIDKDEESIGGLEKPPAPTIHLFYLTLFLDVAATFLALIFVNTLFAGCLVLYIAASRAYSSRQIRLKKYPVIGF
jgi:4-hydroxybenzoate polyprenyltransferase